MRALYAVLVATFVLVAAGCGSSDVGAGGPSAATQLEPGALVYWETESNPDSGQWQQAEELVRRFPDGDRLIAELRKLVAEQGVDWEQDVKPALGETVAIAVYARSGTDSPSVVGLTNPSDPDKTIALVKKLDAKEGGDPSATRVVGDWVVISDKQAAIDAALKTSGGDALADDASFTSAMDRLPDDALTRVYADPAGALDALGGADPDVAKGLKMLGLDRLDFAAAWAKAKAGGAELAVALSGEGASRILAAGEPYASGLLERVPEDAFAFITFQGGAASRQLEQFKTNPLYSMAFQQLERELGITVEDLLALFSGEVALYARPAVPIPEVTLLLDPDNAQDARATAGRLLRNLAGRAGGEITEDGDVLTASFDGFAVSVGTVEGIVVATTSRRALSDLADSGGKLADSDRYKAALETAGVPDEYTGLTYVDLAETIELVLGYLNFAGESAQLPPELGRNLEPLKSLVAWGSLDGNVASAQVFVEID